MGDKFSRVSGLDRADHARNIKTQAPVWAHKEKRASRNAGLFFVILLRTATTFQCELLTDDQRRSGYLPLVSTFCFSSSFIFLTVAFWLLSPIV